MKLATPLFFTFLHTSLLIPAVWCSKRWRDATFSIFSHCQWTLLKHYARWHSVGGRSRVQFFYDSHFGRLPSERSGRRSTNRRRINDQPQLPRDQKRAKSCSAHGQQGNVQSAAGGGDPRRSACYNCASSAWSLWVGELAEARLHSTGRPKRRASGRLQGSQRNFKKRGE